MFKYFLIQDKYPAQLLSKITNHKKRYDNNKVFILATK
jgi:hypothetical protein